MHDSNQSGVPSVTETAPIKVEAAPARIGDLVMRLSTTGLTRALREITIAPKVSGEVVRLPVAEGQFVRKGELLLKLNDCEYVLPFTEAIGYQFMTASPIYEERKAFLSQLL